MMVMCQILYVSDEKVDKEKVDQDKNKVESYSANELAEKLKKIGFDVGEVCENVGFDKTLKTIYQKMFLVSEVIYVPFVQSIT
jgi:hypothetical protein